MKSYFLTIIIFCLSILLYTTVVAQCSQGATTTFQKVYGGAGNERAHSVQQTIDGGYVIVGETTSFGAGGKDWFVMKMNANGVEQWTKTYGGLLNEDGLSVTIKQTNDGGYIICGYTESFGAGNLHDSYVLRIDNLGNILWEKRITGSNIDRFADVKELSNGDFIFTGSDASFSAGNADAHVVKISSSGNLVWIQNLGTTLRDHATSILELPSGNYIVTGNTNITSVRNGFLIKTDPNGSVLLGKEYGEIGAQESIYETILLGDGNLLNVGYAESYGAGNADVWLMKLDTNGIILWSKVYGGVNDERGVNVKEKANGDLIISSHTNSYGNGNELLLFSTDSFGNVLWSKVYGGINNEEIDFWGKSIDLTALDEIIIAGGTTSFGVGGEDIYFVKTNSCGESFCNEQGVTLSVALPNVSSINFIVAINTGGTLINTNTIVSPITFSSGYLCADTTMITAVCNLSANFSSTSFCLGDSTSFTDLSVDSVGNIINWQWYFGDGDSIVGVQNPAHLYSVAGIFNVTLAITNDSNCVDSITIPLTINPSFSIVQNQTICQGDSILLGGSFQTVSGNYIDSLQTPNGCDSIVTTTLSVVNNFINSTTVNVCQGQSVFLGGGNQTIAGIYVDTLQSISGCDSIVTSTLIVNPVPIIIASNDTSIIACSSVQLGVTGASNYTWSPINDLSCINCSNPIATPNSSIIYTVTSTLNGCSSSDDVNVTVDGESTLIIPNIFTPNFDGLNDGFNLQGGCLISVDKKIYNRWGELLFQSNQINEVWNGRTTSGKDVPEGTYFYIFIVDLYENGIEVQKTFTGTVSLLR
jgi:gliding motility-associated-like protein